MIQPRPSGTTESCRETIFLSGNGISLHKNRCGRAVHAAAPDFISRSIEFINKLRRAASSARLISFLLHGLFIKMLYNCQYLGQSFQSLIETFIVFWAFSLPQPYLVNQARQAELPGGSHSRNPANTVYVAGGMMHSAHQPAPSPPASPCSVCQQRNRPQCLLQDSSLRSETQLLKESSILNRTTIF